MFDRCDILAAYHMYSTLWGGDGCHYENRIQVRLSRLGYWPTDSEQYLETLSENAKAIYAGLERRHQGRAIAVQRFIKRANGRLPGLGAPYREIERLYPQALL